ncbi:hypothetical protein [Enterobacter mori]|uniref:hypothetical protein n=1 Tax=Enterobacter mori TaxID=539813 RepID=UPI003B844A0D
MDITIFKNIRGLVLANVSNTVVNPSFDVEGIGTSIPFTATADDSEEHGRQLFQNTVDGMFGAVSLLPPPAEAEIRRIRNHFLCASGPLVITDYSIHDEYLTSTQREELFAVRMNFKRRPAQPGWPHLPRPIVPQWISDELSVRVCVSGVATTGINYANNKCFGMAG